MYIIENSEGKFKLFTNKKLAKLETDVINLWIKPCEDYDFFQYVMDSITLDKPMPIRDYEIYFNWENIEYCCDKMPKWIKLLCGKASITLLDIIDEKLHIKLNDCGVISNHKLSTYNGYGQIKGYHYNFYNEYNDVFKVNNPDPKGSGLVKAHID